MGPAVSVLCARVEGLIREVGRAPPRCRTATPLSSPLDLSQTCMEDGIHVEKLGRFEFLDSTDPNREKGILHYIKGAPAKGDPSYPRLLVENRVYSSRVFRKLHLELATRQDGLEVFHCVMYPRLEFDLPILSMDMVAGEGGRVSLAIIDPCPVSWDRSIPSECPRDCHLMLTCKLPTRRPTCRVVRRRRTAAPVKVRCRPGDSRVGPRDFQRGLRQHSATHPGRHCRLHSVCSGTDADAPGGRPSDSASAGTRGGPAAC